MGGEGVRSYSSLPDFTAAWQGPTEDLGLGAPGLEGGADGAGPSVAELEAERTLLYEVTQRACDDEGRLEGAPEGGGGEPGAESLCDEMRARLRSFEEYARVRVRFRVRVRVRW